MRTHQLIVLAAACLVGTAIGLVALPSASGPIAVMTLAQLAVTGAGRLAEQMPVPWAVAVAIVGLGSALAHPALSELAHTGATPWIGLATAVAALNLYRHGRTWGTIATGSAILVVGSAGLVVVAVRRDVPLATALMATSVYFLLGVLYALVLHLRNARADRLRRPETDVETDQIGAAEAGTAADDMDSARRALMIVALRSDELCRATDDTAVQRAAADLREVADRGLTGHTGAGPAPVIRVEVRPVSNIDDPTEPPPVDVHASSSPEKASSPPEPIPELSEREHEILRLVATGQSNAAIGRSLYLSEATIKQYVSRLMRRFGRQNRTQLALLSARWFDH